MVSEDPGSGVLFCFVNIGRVTGVTENSIAAQGE
jgi:hypothetical protein